MGRWTRQEIEEALDCYQKTALEAGTSGDWNAWADLFTEDATYIEHLYGTFGGREAIRKWISSTMAEWPNHQMQYFPHEWVMIDEERAGSWRRSGIAWSTREMGACTRPTTTPFSSTRGT